MSTNRSPALQIKPSRLPASCPGPLIFFLFLATCALLGACSEEAARESQMEVPIRSVTVRKTELPEILAALGRVEASASVAIRARVSGQLLAKYFEEGQYVEKGARLFSIDPRPYETALAAAEAELERNTILRGKAHEDMKRYQALIGKSVVSKEQYDQIRSTFESLQAVVKANMAAVENARVQLGYCTIYAPVSGKIGRLAVDVGNLIKAEDTPLVSIEQMQPIRVSFTLPERELGRVLQRMAEAVLLVQAFPEGQIMEPIEGRLLFVDNAVEERTGTILLVAQFPNTDHHLFPGQFVKIVLYLGTIRDALVLPQKAVQTGLNGQFVFTVDDENKVHMKQIKTGLQAFGDIAIEGLEEGTRVVTSGHLRLTEGTKVSEVRPNPAASHP